MTCFIHRRTSSQPNTEMASLPCGRHDLYNAQTEQQFCEIGYSGQSHDIPHYDRIAAFRASD